MALIEYQTSKFFVISLHSRAYGANKSTWIVRGILVNDCVMSVETARMALRSASRQRQFAVRVRLFESLTVEDAKPYGLGNDVGNPRFSSRR